MTNTNLQDPPPEQRRHFTRIPFDARFRLTSDTDGTQWQGQILDISLHGVLIQRPLQIVAARGDEFLLELFLHASDVSIQMQARVAHAQDNLIGFECAHIDLESMTHLRRILELNLGDPMLMERELAEMLHTRH